ncbi:MAG: acriflavine resistance protein B [Verrucomicrobia bacterium]|nr:MAG: acriflavine resistance protein B [Verrucomicrobiota bacterium]
MHMNHPFVSRPRSMLLLAVGLFLLGMAAYFTLPIASLPNVEFPTINVNATLPGINPETAATALAAPLERRLGQIAGLEEMTSSSTLGGSSITLQFDLSRNIDSAARDVQAAINAAAHDLPPNLPMPPTYRKANPAGAPIMILAMVSNTMPISKVYDFADEIVAQRLSQISGVSQVLVAGGAKTAVRVQVDPVQLASLGMSLDDLKSFLLNTNHFAPRGFIEANGHSYVLHTNGQLLDASEYQHLVIAQKNGIPIPLSSIANVINGTENTLQGGWFNGRRAVILIIFKQPDANVIQVIQEIRKALPSLRTWIPPAVHLEIAVDRTETIHASVRDIQFTLLLSTGLVILMMLLFLRRLTPTLVAGATVPLALAATFGVMWLCGFSLNNISLMALTVSVGFLVDDAIVVIENIVAYLDEGYTPFDATLLGAKQISCTVISMSISLVAVFLPVLLMGGVVGRLFREFAGTLSAAILVSAIISLTLTPALCGKFLQKGGCGSNNAVAQCLEAQFSKMLTLYQKALAWVLGHEKFMRLVLLVTFIITITLYIVIPKGFFPQQDTGLLLGVTMGSQDISFQSLAAKQNQLAKIVQNDPAVAAVSSMVFNGSGFASNSGRLFIALKPLSERKVHVDQVINRLRPKFAAVRQTSLYLFPAQDLRTGGRIGTGQYQYALSCSDLSLLLKWAPKLTKKLQANSKLADVSSDQQFEGRQVHVVVDRNVAGRLGVEPVQVDSALYSAFGQMQVSTVYSNMNQFHMILEAKPRLLSDPNYLNSIYIKSSSGTLLPLAAVAHFERTTSPLIVNHQGQFAVATLSFNLKPGVSLGESEHIVEQAKRDLHMPDSIKGEFAGNAKVFKKTASSQTLLILGAIGAVYIILGILYENLIHPLTILSTLPTAGAGALLALHFSGLELSVVAIIGIILLIGIVKKNAIMMVDFALEAQREQKLNPREAIYQACLKRFRPIMMTNAAALFGSIPLAIGFGTGSELRQPLGVAIVGGLLVSQLLTLFTTPVVYLTLERTHLVAKALYLSIANSLRQLERPVS